MAMHAAKHFSTYISQGRTAEDEGELEKAAEYYELAIKQEPLEEWPYNRLMIIYRKLKQYKDEARVITKGLKVFKEFYEEKAGRLFNRNKKLEQTGKALLKSLSHGGKSPNYQPEPIPKWTKRLQVVEKKSGSKIK
jgi:tetratricopeptide (TPR) repeat protein